ncbi:hypothetical protein WKR88_29000 [Trinickia caryophylli]|uniref:hypothetical protein n=1 Tax=Trinickia caryophylli TaxID=28094 RepID=UPI000A1574F0|nr:hypothetical protein [Trinickia caryophylli]PMS10048.1 hypothetical protein C0Z17_22340 [Trinickia caryophylli]TRX18405.1 hypothetical protein FNF07_09370 [Trinickia caryophylli]WQE10811.1 hypothetical protein U0034_13560 [Trinickia caryophylli]GLU35887.1 hypothetical protein Busp01_57290 [Trinickia caryophylli]
MKISDIASRVDFLAILGRDDLDRMAMLTLQKALGSGCVERFLSSEGSVDEYTRDGILQLLRRRNDGLARQGRTLDGYAQAVAAVRSLSEDERISWLAILMPTDISIILVRVATFDVLACLSLNRSETQTVKRPSNWDGSKIS